MRAPTLSCLALLLPLACAPATAQSERTAVKLGMVGRPDIAAFELAIHRGYFDKQGLDVEPVLATSGQEFAAALATDQIQVASGVPNAALFNALNRGIDIRMVADEAHIEGAADRTVSIMVRAALIDEGTVKVPADLKGRTIAPGPLPGQYPDLLFHKLLALGGLTEADVKVVHLTFPDALAAMAAKTVDAAFQIEPLVRQAEDKHIAKVLSPAGAIDPGAETSILQYSSSFARQTEAATRFMVAYLEGVRDYHDAIFLKQNRDAAIALLVQYTPLKDANIWAEDMFRHTDLNGRLNVADLKRQAAFYKEQGTLSGRVPDIDRYVDARFAEDAVKRIGAR
jgi:NitT/TauT family transport system substrate-binding protein